MKTLGMIVGLIILGICVQNLSCKDKAEAVELKDIADPDNVVLTELYESERKDVVFCYEDNGNTKSVRIDVIDNEIVCNMLPKEAIRIIYNTVYNIYREETDFVDLPVRFPEPNEPECKGHGVNAIYCPECHSLDYLLELEEPECKK